MHAFKNYCFLLVSIIFAVVIAGCSSGSSGVDVAVNPGSAGSIIANSGNTIIQLQYRQLPAYGYDVFGFDDFFWGSSSLKKGDMN